MKNSIEKELMKAWRKGNNAGNGYAVGDDDQDPGSAAHQEGYQDIIVIDPEGAVVANDDGKTIVVCPANGPWAVDVTDDVDLIGNKGE